MASNRLRSAFARMSDRERMMVVGGAALVSMVLIMLIATMATRRVDTLREHVELNNEALADVIDLAPDYLRNRREEKAIDEQLTRAANTSLQSTLLGISKEVRFELKYLDAGGTQTVRMSDYIKFANSTEILAELTKKTSKSKKRRRKKKKKDKDKDERQVFMASIEVIFDRVPDSALFQFLAKVDSHPDALFGTSLDIRRDSPNHEHFKAKLKVGQFRYGKLEQ
jgi:hypothetical protein